MPLPTVNIELTNGSIGGAPVSNDGIAGMVLTGIATTHLPLNTPRALYSITEVEDLGINEQYDQDNATDAYRHCKNFYDQAGNGAKLWIILVPETTTMENILDGETAPAGQLLNQADGEIRLLGITRNPNPETYTPTYTDGIDPDVVAAVTKAQTLAESRAALYSPLSILIEGRDFQENVSSLYDLRSGSNNRVSVVLGNDQGQIGVDVSNNPIFHKGAFVGLVLGRMASLPVQRNIGRVKDGDIRIRKAFISGGNPINHYNSAALDTVHDKGYIFARKYIGKNGFYFNDDPTATAITDDYAYQSRRRVIDKAVRLLYNTYVNELLDDLELNPETGKMAIGAIKSYQVAGERVLTESMLVNGEISGVNVFVDPEQNVMVNNQISVNLGIIPKGYAKEIVIELGFANPQNS